MLISSAFCFNCLVCAHLPFSSFAIIVETSIPRTLLRTIKALDVPLPPTEYCLCMIDNKLKVYHMPIGEGEREEGGEGRQLEGSPEEHLAKRVCGSITVGEAV